MTKKKKRVEKKKDIAGHFFVGSIFLGLAVGALAGSLWIGGLFGLGVGFISKGIIDSLSK